MTCLILLSPIFSLFVFTSFFDIEIDLSLILYTIFKSLPCTNLTIHTELYITFQFFFLFFPKNLSLSLSLSLSLKSQIAQIFKSLSRDLTVSHGFIIKSKGGRGGSNHVDDIRDGVCHNHMSEKMAQRNDQE